MSERQPKGARAVPVPPAPPPLLTVRDNVPPGATLVFTPSAKEALIRLLGEEVLRRAFEAPRHPDGG